MTDLEIKQYIDKNKGIINAQDCVMNILNTSHQIVSEKYDFNSKTMILKTPDNIFTFKLILGQL